MLLVFVARVQELIHFLVPLHMGIVSVFLASTFFVLSSKPQQHVSLRQIPQVKIVAAIFVLAIVSVPFSVWPGQSFGRLVPGFTLTLMFFLLLIYAVNNFEDLQKILWTYICGVFLLAFFTITADGAGRLSASGTYDPNDISLLFVITLPIIYFFMSSRNGLVKLILFGSMLVILFAFILTVSRGGFIGLLVIALLILFMDKYRYMLSKLLVLGISVFFFVQFAPDTYWDRIETITNYKQDYNVQSEHGRKTIWLRGLKLMIKSPFVGQGFGAYTTAMGHTYGQGVSGFKWSTAHNAFILIGAELGVGGFILFILLILISIRMLRKLRGKYAKHPGDFKNHLWLTAALEISLWGYVVTAMFLSVAYHAMFYFLIALCCILIKLDYLDKNKEKMAHDVQEPENQRARSTA